MLINTQAELMYPSLAGLGGLGCADCFNTCGCSPQNGLSGLGAGSGWDSWYCQGVLAPNLFPWCVPPTPSEQGLDTSNYGGHLSIDSQVRATQMAQDIISNDPSLQAGENVNWLLIGGIVIGAIIIIKKV